MSFSGTVYLKHMKKNIYIAIFTIFTVSLAALVHITIELLVLTAITANPDILGSSFIMEYFLVLRLLLAFVLFILGLILGIKGGQKFWRVCYIDKRFGTPWL
jgi:hypothetical protein